MAAKLYQRRRGIGASAITKRNLENKRIYGGNRNL
jgi:hypothetical protein